MKKYFMILALIGTGLLNAQVGINTDKPEVTLDVRALENSIVPNGLLIPRLDADQLKANNVSADHNSLLIYFNGDHTALPQGDSKYKQITGKGYYYYDAAAQVWTTFNILKKLTQNDNTGIVRVGRENDPGDYLEIGNHAVDLSYNDESSKTTGASGGNSTAMGYGTTASGGASTAMGHRTTASGVNSTAMGRETKAKGGNSTAMGRETKAEGGNSTAMGHRTTASGVNSTAMGRETKAEGGNSTAMGDSTIASGRVSLAMGDSTTASAWGSTAMGVRTIALGAGSTAMGSGTTASGAGATTMGSGTIASGDYSTAMGVGTTAESRSTLALGEWNTPEQGSEAKAFTDMSKRLLVVGNGTQVSPSDALILYRNGDLDIQGQYLANGENINVLKKITKNSNTGIVRVGRENGNVHYLPIGDQAVDLSYNRDSSKTTGASGSHSIAMGRSTTASGVTSTAMGDSTTASAWGSTAMGVRTIASGDYSTAMGVGTTAESRSTLALGEWNTPEQGSEAKAFTDMSKRLLVVGNGISDRNRSDALTLYRNGDLNIKGQYLSNGYDIGVLKKLTQGSNTGIARVDRENGIGHYRPMGNLAVDLSFNDESSKTTGASGGHSIAMGRSTTASGVNSTAMGRNTTASGSISTAMGNHTTASGLNSTAMGLNTTASGLNSTAMGFNTTAESQSTVALGQFNTSESESESGAEAEAFADMTKRLLVVGNGTSGSNLSDALTLYRNGNLYIQGQYHSKSSNSVQFPDYVFEKYYKGSSALKSNYTFSTLAEVEAYVKEKGHLPGYKSAKTIKEEGTLNMTETQLTNVEKIEELFLHTIEQEKAIKAKDAKISELEAALKAQGAKLKAQEARLEKLEQLMK